MLTRNWDSSSHQNVAKKKNTRVRASIAVVFRPHRSFQCGCTAWCSIKILWASEGVRPTYNVSVVPAMLLPCSNVVDLQARTTKASELPILKLIASTTGLAQAWHRKNRSSRACPNKLFLLFLAMFCKFWCETIIQKENNLVWMILGQFRLNPPPRLRSKHSGLDDSRTAPVESSSQAPLTMAPLQRHHGWQHTAKSRRAQTSLPLSCCRSETSHRQVLPNCRWPQVMPRTNNIYIYR